MGDKMIQDITAIFNDISNVENDNEILCLNNNLNELVLDYFNYLKNNLDLSNKKNIDYIFNIIEMLDIKDNINKIMIGSNVGCNGYFNNQNKELVINFNELVQYNKMGILKTNILLIEYFTVLFHELYHALQYKYLENNTSLLISKMKRLSILFKKTPNIDNQFHDLIPDEREASIESAKLVYKIFSNDLTDISKKEVEENLIFYLINGYAMINNKFLNPISSINKSINGLKNLNINCNILNDYNNLIYGFPVKQDLYYKLMETRYNQKIDKELMKILKI